MFRLSEAQTAFEFWTEMSIEAGIGTTTLRGFRNFDSCLRIFNTFSINSGVNIPEPPVVTDSTSYDLLWRFRIICSAGNKIV